MTSNKCRLVLVLLCGTMLSTTQIVPAFAEGGSSGMSWGGDDDRRSTGRDGFDAHALLGNGGGGGGAGYHSGGKGGTGMGGAAGGAGGAFSKAGSDGQDEVNAAGGGGGGGGGGHGYFGFSLPGYGVAGSAGGKGGKADFLSRLFGGGGGGAGGWGASIESDTDLGVLATDVTGAAGGRGGDGYHYGGDGGTGGTGLHVAGSYSGGGGRISLTVNSVVTGGAGGFGGLADTNLTYETRGGSGGLGGTAIYAGRQVDLTINGSVIGGKGSIGGDAADNAYATYGGRAGHGGTGIDLASPGSSLLVNGRVIGGDGANGGNGGSLSGAYNEGGNGSWGGNGVVATQAVLRINGQVAGGNGGIGGTSAGISFEGLGGRGIFGSDLTITIGATATVASGFAKGGTGVQAPAIYLYGGTNSLSFEGPNSNLSGSIDVFQGTMTFNQTGIDTIVANAIVGGVSLIKSGDAMITLTGANTYSGGTTLSAGTLRVSRDENLGGAAGALSFAGGTLHATGNFDTARAVALQGAGRFQVAANTSLGLSGVVSGNNDLVKAGPGTLKLGNGGNAYRNTLVEAGTLIGDASSISGHIGNAGTVVFDQVLDGGFAGNIAALDGSKGTMIKRGAGRLALTGASVLDWTLEGGSLSTRAGRFGGDAVIGAGTTLTFNDQADASYAGTFSGSGTFAKTGSGTVKLSGDSSGFSGSTSVEGGTLSVDGRLGGSVDVLVGGRLQGKGTVGSLKIAAASTVAPGNSIGTLNVAGEVSFAAGATYEVEIAGNGTSDRVAAGGKATLGLAKVAVTALDAETSYQTGQAYTILTAGGGVVGSFDPSVLSRSAFLDATLAYSANAVDLKIVVKKTEEPGKPEEPGKKPLFATVADTPNRTQTAGALDTLQQSGPSLALYNKLLVLSADEAHAAFDGLSGEVNTSTVTGLIEDSQLLRDAVNDRLRAAFEAVGALPLMGYGDDAKEMATASLSPAERYGAWGSAFGSWGSTDSDGNAGKLSRSTGGFVTGIDGFVTDDWRLGFLAGYSHSSFKGDDRRSSASSDNYHLGIYAGTQMGALSFRSGLAYTWSDIDSSRQVSFAGFADGLSGSYRAGTTQVFGELGYAMKAGTIAFEPFANLAYVNVHSKGFTETGGAAALTVQSGSNDISFTTLGVRASTDFDLGSIKATARGMIGWRHGYGDFTPTIMQAFAGSSAFTIAGAPIARDSAVIEAGLDFAIAPQATLGISYQGQLGSKAHDHGVRADLSVRF